MKNTPHIEQVDRRHQSEPRTPRRGQAFPQTDYAYQSCRLNGACGSPAQFQEPAFFKISSEYFAGEAQRGFAVEAAVFAALIGTALLPIANGVQAVATLLHSAGVV
jgi:hypothetical protein